MKAVFKIKEAPTRIPETNKGDSKMKANTFFYTRLILGLALAIAFLAANPQGFALANASAISVDNIATTRHLTMVYETPSVDSRVAMVLMPVTEVSLAGRSADGKWLALGNGWIQRSDISTDSDLAALPVAQVAQTFIATTRHLTMVYETPSVDSRVAYVLMPVTEVSLAGRSADGKWLVLGNGWFQRSDIRTDSDLAALPVARAEQTFNATTRHLTMVYETPSVDSRVAYVLMPVTDVSLAGRSADGKWLALGNSWIKKGDIHTDGNLAFLPILDVVAAMDLIAGH